jgi:hypothetical protein
MLFTTSQDSIKRAFEYVAKLPFLSHLLHKLSERARGHCLVFFSLHRVLEDSSLNLAHPHRQNKTAITSRQAHRLLTELNHRLPFISLADALEYLRGNRKMNGSCAVLLVEVPYLQTVRQLNPLLEELRIPATYVLSTESLEDGQMPWTDEIVFRLGSTSKTALSVTFIDRAFSLQSPGDRMLAAQHLIENLSHRTPSALFSRMNELRESLLETAIPPVGERICTIQQLEKIALNPLFSFANGGKQRIPLADISLPDAQEEIIQSKQILLSIFSRAFIPVFFHGAGSDKRHHKELVKLFIDNGYQAAITRNLGVCRPGDNMYRLLRLPLAYGVRSFEQFELQGLSDAIDEFLLVTLGQEREL